ncbi:MOSC domain-containing protein [soil metagenome]
MTNQPTVLSVNVGRSAPVGGSKGGELSGIDKAPTASISVRDPGDRATGAGSGVVGDAIVDRRHHGGERQALYAVAREELDYWASELGRELPSGAFGENLTTTGIGVDALRIGSLLQIGGAPAGDDAAEPGQVVDSGRAIDSGQPVVLEVCGPRIPCATFSAHLGERGWVKTFTARRRPGAYLAVRSPGQIVPGDVVALTQAPDHDITVADLFAALSGDLDAARAVLAAGCLPTQDHDELAAKVARRTAGRS